MRGPGAMIPEDMWYDDTFATLGNKIGKNR